MTEYETAEDAYRGILEDVVRNGRDDGEGNLEVINCAFSIRNLSDVDFKNKTRGFKREFAQQFLDFIMAGGTDASVLFSSNPNAKKFTDDLASRNTAYGPRILAQMPAIIEEMTKRPSTRRAAITILSSDDQSLLNDKRLGSGMEYPCTVSLIFLLRDGKLNLHVAMRSNNMTTTVCYDIFNFTSIQKVLLSKLKDGGMDVRLGKYFHVCASAHVLKDEIRFAKSILAEYPYGYPMYIYQEGDKA